MKAVVKREQTGAAAREWPGQASWTRARDVLISLYLVFLFHDLFFRLLGSELLPAVVGISLPPVPWRDAIVLVLICLGLWRMAKDEHWRRRFREPTLWWQVACFLLIAAFLSLHATSFARINISKGLLYPLIMFFIGILAGFDWRKVRNMILGLAIINIGIALLIGLFFMDEYRLWITAYRTVFGEDSALVFGKYENIFLLPMPLILERTNLAVLYIVAGAVSLYQALWDSPQRRQRLYYGVLCSASMFMVLACFSRAGIVTMFLTLLGLFSIWSVQRALKAGKTIAQGLVPVGAALLLLAMIGLASAFAVRAAYGVDMLDPSNLISQGREGRITIWARVVDDINRQRGWLTGITPTYRFARPSIIFGAKGGNAWSEWSYYTVDNAYLYMIMQGGIFSLAGQLAFLMIAAWQFQRYKCYLALVILVSGCLVWWMLATMPMLISLTLLLGSGRLGNKLLAEADEKPPTKAPAGALPAST